MSLVPHPDRVEAGGMRSDRPYGLCDITVDMVAAVNY
jgi:hypothetical protein